MHRRASAITVWASNLPPAVNGIALGNVGVGVALLNIFRDNGILTPWSLWVVYGLTLYAITLLSLYWVRVIFNWHAFLKEDLSKPQPLSAIGAHSMAVMLVAVIAAMPELSLDIRVGLAISVYGSAVQLGSMSLFLFHCFNERCWPEPFYNAAIHSCQFIVVSIPSGVSSSCEMFRRVIFFFGLIMLLPSLPAQIFRTVTYPTVVAQNYTVCIMQAAFSISLTAWLVFPLTRQNDSDTDAAVTAATGRGAEVSHLLFVLSTLTYLLTWVGIYQRRHVLRKLGDHASVSSATFPFVNSAISANLYRITLNRVGAFTPAGHGCLQGWVYLITLVSILATMTGNVMYARNRFFSSVSSSSSSIALSLPSPFAKDDALEKVTLDDHHSVVEVTEGATPTRQTNPKLANIPESA